MPFKWHLQYEKGLKGFTGNIYTAFGTAIHSVCEQSALGNLPEEEFAEHFDIVFLDELKKLDEKPKNKMIVEMRKQSHEIFTRCFWASKAFPGYKVYSSEEDIYETNFGAWIHDIWKVFIDLVIKTPDGKHHIIDWKSCSWGWDMKRKSDSMTTYQLTLYKKFFCENMALIPKMLKLILVFWRELQKKIMLKYFAWPLVLARQKTLPKFLLMRAPRYTMVLG